MKAKERPEDGAIRRRNLLFSWFSGRFGTTDMTKQLLVGTLKKGVIGMNAVIDVAKGLQRLLSEVIEGVAYRLIVRESSGQRFRRPSTKARKLWD